MANPLITYPLPQNISDRSFQGMDCVGWDFSGRDIRGCDFNNAKLNGANFNRVTAGKSKKQIRVHIISIFISSFIAAVIIPAISVLLFKLGFRMPPFPLNYILGFIMALALKTRHKYFIKWLFPGKDIKLLVESSREGGAMGTCAGISAWLSILGVGVAIIGFSQCFKFSDERLLLGLLVGVVGSLITLFFLFFQFYVIREIFGFNIEYKVTWIVNKAPGTNFKDADLEGADFSHAVLNDCNFTHANIEDVIWNHVKGLRSSINFKTIPITQSSIYKFL